MVNFLIVRKGYDVKQVDSYINKVVSFSESKLLEQKNRIDSLKEENKKLQDKINEYEKQAAMVSEALINATKKSNEIINASKMRFALESERIKLMRAKWTSYIESSMAKIYKLDESINMQAYLSKMDDELRTSIGNDLNIHKARLFNDAEEQFMSERARLNNINDKDILNEMTESVLKNETNADRDDNYVEKVKEAISNNVKQAISDNNFGDRELEDDLEEETLSEFRAETEKVIKKASNKSRRKPKNEVDDIMLELGFD